MASDWALRVLCNINFALCFFSGTRHPFLLDFGQHLFPNLSFHKCATVGKTWLEMKCIYCSLCFKWKRYMYICQWNDTKYTFVDHLNKTYKQLMSLSNSLPRKCIYPWSIRLEEQYFCLNFFWNIHQNKKSVWINWHNYN